MAHYKQEVVDLLQKLVRFESVNPPGKEKEIGDFIYDYLTEAGLETKKVFAAEDRYNVVAILPGEKRDGILFTGHMDVVPVPEEEKERWNVAPFGGTIIDDYLYGRGSSDMKSGLAAAMVAMKTLKEENVVPDRDIALAVTVDEEDSMIGSKALIGSKELAGYKNCVVCEPTGLRLCNRGRGRTYGNLYIKGHTGHGSRPNPNNNAILLANKIIDKMNRTDFSYIRTPEDAKSFWQPLAIDAGVEPCVVPDKCTMKIDARLVLGHDPDDIWLQMKKIIDELTYDLPELSVKIDIIDKRESWTTSPETEIMKRMKEVYEDLNLLYETDIFTGTTDGTMFRRDGRDTVIIGPGDLGVVHKENEKVFIPEVQRAADIYLELMHRGFVSGKKIV